MQAPPKKYDKIWRLAHANVSRVSELELHPEDQSGVVSLKNFGLTKGQESPDQMLYALF